MEFGRPIAVSPATLNKINFFEVWLKVDTRESNDVPRELLTKFLDGMCSIKVKAFNAFEVLVKMFTCLSSSSVSSRGNRILQPRIEKIPNSVEFFATIEADAAGKMAFSPSSSS